MVIKRIIEAYHKAKDVQKTLSGIWQPSNLWMNFMTCRLPLIEALDSRNEAEVARLLSTMLRNGSTAYTSYLRCWFALKDNNKEGLESFKNILKTQVGNWKMYAYPDDTLEDLVLPKIGGLYGGIISGISILPGAPPSHYHARKVQALVEDIDNPTVVEIGGGMGLFPYFLTKDTDIHYIEYDLPEILVTCQYYLMTAFPEKRFLLYGEEPTESDYDYILLPHFELPNLPDNSADVFVNFHSLSEMDLDTVDEYMKHITRATKSYFYHENSMYPVIPVSELGDLHEIIATQFNIPDYKFTRIYMMPNVFGENVYYEFLYKRR